LLQVAAPDQDEWRRVLQGLVGLDQLAAALVDRDVADVEDERLGREGLEARVAGGRRRQLADEVGHHAVQLRLDTAAVANRGADRQEDVYLAPQPRLGEAGADGDAD